MRRGQHTESSSHCGRLILEVNRLAERRRDRFYRGLAVARLHTADAPRTSSIRLRVFLECVGALGLVRGACVVDNGASTKPPPFYTAAAVTRSPTSGANLSALPTLNTRQARRSFLWWIGFTGKCFQRLSLDLLSSPPICPSPSFRR